jgi:hypothetical protein
MKRLGKTLNQQETYMKARSVLILGMTLLFGSVAIAQDDHKLRVRLIIPTFTQIRKITTSFQLSP